MYNKIFKLAEICEIKSGKRIPKDMRYVEYPTLHPYIRARDIKDGKISTDDLIYIEDKVYEKIKKYIINKNDIAITIVGASVGDVGYAENDIDGYNLTENAVRLTNFKSFVNSKYLFYIISQKQYHDYMQLVAGAAAQPKLGIYKVERIKIELPSIEIQNKISSILSTYDNLIENNNKRIKLLEQMAENLYKEWFVRFRFPGYENAEFENGIPKGWKKNKIKSYYTTCSGGTPSRSKPQYYENGIYPWIKTGEIKDCIIIDAEEYITQEALDNSSAKIIPANSVIMAMYGVNIGSLAYIADKMTCNQACCVFSDKRSFSSKHYLYNYLKSIREYLLSISFGAAQQNLSQDLIKNIAIVMPTDSIVKEFEAYVDSVYNNIKILLQKNQNLIKQRDLLLPRLMSGKLEVE